MRTTYFLEVDYGTKLGRCFVETEPGRTESDVIDQISRGDTPGLFRNIYRVGLNECEEVTDAIAEKVWRLGGPWNPEAIEWLEWVGYDVRDAAE